MAAQVALAFVLCSVAAWGQNAQLSGLIRDPSFLNVINAQISVRNGQTGGKRVTRSNGSGFYSVYSLSPGTYRITIQAAGFETIIREGVKLEVGESAQIDFALSIGDSRTVVTVSSDTPIINTQDASVGTVISRNLIDQIPLNGRGIQTLIELTPGTVMLPVTQRSVGQFSINGQRDDANSFTVDGVSANFAPGVFTPGIRVPGAGNPNFTAGPGNFIGQGGTGAIPANNFLGTFSNLVSPDALQEFRIETSTFAPEFGRSPGGQIGLVTRSGTNRYSGSLFEYFRNDVTDANDWFTNRLGLNKPPLRFNDFGGSLGGPVRIPRLYNGRERTFFFLSFEDLVMRQPQGGVEVLVPSAQARSEAPAPVAPLLNAFPLPNRPQSDLGLGLPGWAAFAGNSVIRPDQETVGLRLDQNVGQKLNVFARYNHAPSTRIEPAPPEGSESSLNLANVQRYSIQTDMLTLGLTHTLSSNLVNEIRLNGSRQAVTVDSDITNLNGAQRPPASLLFPPGYSAANSVFNCGLVFSSLSLGILAKDSSSQVQAVDSVSYTRGTHQLKFGADYRRLSSNAITPLLSSTMGFSAIYDAAGGVYGGVAPDELLQQTNGGFAFTVPAFSAYAQDTWRVGRKLTLTYGVRWELDPAPKANKGQFVTVTGLSNLYDLSNISLAAPGASLYPTRYRNFAPRFGLAWQLSQGWNRETVLRLGAGTFYDLGQSGFEDLAYQSTSASFYTNQRLGTLPSGTPSYSVTSSMKGADAVATVPTYRLPRTYQWNVTIEQSIAKQTFSAAYVGALGRRLIGIADLSSLPISDGSTLSALQLFGNSSSSSYNSLQLRYNRRLASHAQLLLSYTWSHSIDNLSNELGSVENSLEEFVRPNIDRGPSDFDIRHNLHGAVIVNLPAPRSRRMAIALRNWTASSIFFARSAAPTDLYTYGGVSGIARPDAVPDEPLYFYGSEYPGGKRFNPDAFTIPPADVVQGDLGRNVLRGFGAWQIDFALRREVRLSEQVTLQIRAEAFNILNHPNFANPTEELSDPLRELVYPPFTNKFFGISSATLANGLAAAGTPGELNSLFQVGGPRSLQFALRLSF